MKQTLTTTEELKHLASSDNANELTRRLARECLANREAQPVGFIEQSGLDYLQSGADADICRKAEREIYRSTPPRQRQECHQRFLSHRQSLSNMSRAGTTAAPQC